jgi:phosphoserine phosphatase
MDVLQLHLNLAAGHEIEAARYLRARVDDRHWPILAALAAELVALHEAATGSTVVVVTGAAQAERVLRDLQRDQPALPAAPL